MLNLRKGPLVRFLEILPGSLAWMTIILAPILSYYHPVWISLYIILFDFYWFLKGMNVAIHLIHSYRELKANNKIDWQDWMIRLRDKNSFVSYLQSKIQSETDKGLRRVYRKELAQLLSLPADRSLDWTQIHHVVVLAAVNEGPEVLGPSIESYINAEYDHSKVIFALAIEEHAGEAALAVAAEMERKYSQAFAKFIIAVHPDNIPGEVRGKAGNFKFAAQRIKEYLDQSQIPLENVIFSGLDSDTVIAKNYFSHFTYHWLTADKPHQTSYQPLPVYNNNIWDTPAVARVVAVSSSFWQLIEASRPDRVITFASHAMSFKTLVELDYFQVDSINEDSFIFWQGFLHFNGDYKTEPMFTLVSMDAVQGENYTGTLVAQYKQKRRWAYGVKQISEVLPLVWANKKIPLWKRFIYSERMIEGYYFWATGSIMLAVLGWLPLILGGDRFGETVLAFNLPFLTRIIMTIATFFLVFSVYINFVLLPPRPKIYGKMKTLSMFTQWVFSPIVASLFGSIPALDAQTRLMLGKYMGSFWVTPKHRREIKAE
jgi:hypothetical protein